MSGARFRFRDASGTEQALSSVEELSARVEGGEVTPDTELFDAGAGGWSRAGDLPIFQFIVDELRMEGRLPESFERADPPPPPATPPPPPATPPRASDEEKAADAPSPGSDRGFHIEGVEELEETGETPSSDAEPTDETEGPRPSMEELPLTPDPFEMHLPRTADPSPTDEEPPEEDPEPGDADPPRPARRPGKPKEADDIPLHEWLLESKGASQPDGDAVDEDREPDLAARKGFGSRAPDDDRPRRLRDLEPLAGATPRPGARRPPSEDSSGPAAGGMPAVDDPDPGAGTPGEIRSRPPPPRKDGRGRHLLRRRDRRRSMVVSLLLGGGVIIGIAMFALNMGNSEAPAGAPPGGEGPAPSPTEPALDLPAFPLPVDDPDELATLLGGTGDEMAVRMETLVRESLDALLDSIRVEEGLSAVPPPGWLGGSYLSAASTFDEVSDFWDGYEDFIRYLMEADEELHREAARRAWLELIGEEEADEPDGIPDPRLEVFLDGVSERYALVGPVRQARYEGRLRVADAARELHGFLLDHEDRIEYAPALGRGISRDPILEAVPGDEDTRRELDRQLDRLFIALDQTRQGVPPALGGLRTELFHRLREPV